MLNSAKKKSAYNETELVVRTNKIELNSSHEIE